MRKTHLFLGFVAMLSLGLGIAFAQPTTQYANAQDEVVEVVEDKEEVINEENNVGEVVNEDEQTPVEDPSIKDIVINEYEEVRETIKEVLNQPLVIGGVSITLGTIILFVISKIVGLARTKKIKELTTSIKNYASKMSNCVDIKDYNELVSNYNALLPVLQALSEQVKNVGIKENVKQLLLEFKPIAIKGKDFAIEEHDKVVKDTKEFVKNESSELLDILNS